MDKFKQENISRDSWDQYFHLFPFKELNADLGWLLIWDVAAEDGQCS